MVEQKIRWAKTVNVKSPVRGTELSAGIDLFIPPISEIKSNIKGENYSISLDKIKIKPGGNVLIPSGLKFNLNDFPNTCLIAFNKSGVSTKKNLSVGACVIDQDYQGEVHIHLFNFGNKDTLIQENDKIVQLVHIPVIYSSLQEKNLQDLFNTTTKRGEGGFGSTGN